MRFGEQDSSITFLKLDVEGSEFDSMAEWMDTDALRNVQQVGVELHLDGKSGGKDPQLLATTLRSLQRMHKSGLRLAAYSPNMCQARWKEADQMYHSFFDLLFVRTKTRRKKAKSI